MKVFDKIDGRCSFDLKQKSESHDKLCESNGTVLPHLPIIRPPHLPLS